MKQKTYFIFISIFLCSIFSRASDLLDIEDINQIQYVHRLYDHRAKKSITELNYFYTWTDTINTTSNSYPLSLNKKINFSNDNQIVQDNEHYYRQADMVAMLTPIKFRIIPYNKNTYDPKSMEYIATVNRCYKGPCHVKTIHYQFDADTGETFSSPYKIPEIIYLHYDKKNKMYDQIDAWAYLPISKEMFKAIEKDEKNNEK